MREMEPSTSKLQLVLNFGQQRKRYLIRRSNVKQRIAKRLNLPDTDFELEHLSWKSKGWEKIEERNLKDMDEIRVKGHIITDLENDSDSELYSDAEKCVKIRRKLKKNEKLSEAEREFVRQILWLIQPKIKNGMIKKGESAIVEVNDQTTQTPTDLQQEGSTKNDLFDKFSVETEASNGVGSCSISELTDKNDDEEMSETEVIENASVSRKSGSRAKRTSKPKEKTRQDFSDDDEETSETETLVSSNVSVSRKSDSRAKRTSKPKEKPQQDFSDENNSDNACGERTRKKRKCSIPNRRTSKRARKSDTKDVYQLSITTILNRMKTELKKESPDSEAISKLMDASFISRQTLILNKNPPVREILKTYPALKLSQQVIEEYHRYKDDVDFGIFVKNLKRYSDAIIKNLPSSYSSSYRESQFVNMALLNNNNERKSTIALLLLPSYFEENVSDFISFGKEKKNVYPMIICNNEAEDMFEDDADFTVQVENTKLCTAKTLETAFYAYMGAFYIFSIEFPGPLTQTISLVESMFLGGVPEAVIDKVEDVKKNIMSKV